MQAEQVRARLHAVRERSQRARQALARRASGERPDEVLARDRQQQWPLELVQATDLLQQSHRLGRRLAEVGPRVEEQLLASHARGDRGGNALAQEGHDLPRDVVVAVRILQPLPRCRHGVHEHQRRARLRAHAGETHVAQAADVVHDHRAGLDRRARDGGLVRVDRHGRPELARDPLDQRHDALDLLLGRDRRPVRARRLPADVEEVRARREQLAGQPHVLLQRAAPAPVAVSASPSL